MTAFLTDQYYIHLWLEQEGKELLLEPLFQWLTQFQKDRQDRLARVQQANKINIGPPTPLSDPEHYAFQREQHDRHLRLAAQHTQCINGRESERARADIAPPCPMLSFEHCTLAFEYLEKFQAQALTSPLVRDVVDFLQRIVNARDFDLFQSKKERVSRALREQARSLLQALLELLVPVLEPLSFQEQTSAGHNLRANMLAMYEWEYKKLKQTWEDHKKQKKERLTVLQKVYTERSVAELNTWIDELNSSSIAEKLVAEQFESTVSENQGRYASANQAVRHYLRQARRERDASAATRATYRKMIDSRK